MGKSTSLSLWALLVISVLWKPVYTNDKCSLACKGLPPTPTFLNGHKYNYGVEGTVSIFLTGADKQETSVKLLGQVTVTAIGNCVNELKVQNLVISGPDGKKYGSPEGVDKPVRFTLEGGRVGPEICSEEGDNRRSLNIKRAIISLLQSENKPSTQTDVFGVCPTDVTYSQEGAAFLVHRSRDLSRCGLREQGKNDLVTAVYDPLAEIKSTQILQSHLNVESKVNSGVPEKVSATEEYLYKPFSVGENGARAKVHTKLTLTGKAAGAPTGKCVHPRTIIFENAHGYQTTGTSEDVVSAVKDAAKTLEHEASSKSAAEFANVIRIMKSVSKDDLLKAYKQCGNALTKRVFLDALVRVGSGASVAASLELLESKALSPLETKVVMLSLGNAQHVDHDALKAAAKLLDSPNLPNEVYLGVGALAGAYCRDHNCHHSKPEGIVAVSQKLAAKLNCKPKTKIEEDKVVAVMKGIRNVRHLEDNIIDKLVRCANDHGVKARVKVAALEAFSADPCASKLKKAAIELMKNRQLDSEIRIKAYLAVIACPCGGSATEIKSLLETEPVHQVGRFISTSLSHIRASSNPDKHLARQHYGQIRTPQKFNVDDRKYSFYREVSHNIEALGVGGTLEETVIFSQDSFIPRSANLNLTAEIFGHNVNIFEIGGRQGNLDRVLEHFLGPKGFFRTHNIDEIYEKFKDVEKEVEDTVRRGRRSVKTEIDNFDKHLKAESEPYNNELDLDLYLRLFGTDSLFLSLGDNKGFDINNIVKSIMQVVGKGVDELKHFEQDVRAHLLFLNTELAYPTSTGLPLKLKLVGSATGRFEVSTKVDVRQIIKSPKNAKLDVKLVPSTDIEIAGLFLVDANVVATGLKISNNLHSSTGGHVVFKVLEDGTGIDLQLGLPLEKQEIVTASSDLVFVTAETGKKVKVTPLKIDTERKEYHGCFDQLSGVLGLTLCADLSVPFTVSGPDAQASITKFLARYPLTGPAKVKVILEKNDLRGYHVKALYKHGEKTNFNVLFETEGAKSNRKVSLSGELIHNPKQSSLSLSLDSPFKVLHAEAGYLSPHNSAIVYAKLKNDAEEYYAKAGFNYNESGQRKVLKPIAEYQLPTDKQKQVLKIDGELIMEPVGNGLWKYSLEGIKINLPSSTNDIIEVNGQYVQAPNGFDMNLKAKKAEHNLALTGSLKGKNAKVEFRNTLNPYVNFGLTGYFENTDVYHNDIELVYGQELNNPNNKIIVNQLLKYHNKDAKNYNILSKNKFEIKALPLKIKVNLDVDPKKLNVDLEGQYVDKKAALELDARVPKTGEYSVKVNADVNDKGIELIAKKNVVSAEKDDYQNIVHIKNIAKYELSGIVVHKQGSKDFNYGANGNFKVSGSKLEENIKFDVGVKRVGPEYASHAKITGTKAELLDYLLTISHAPTAKGNLKLILKDAIAVNGQYLLAKEGQGHGSIIIDFKKSQRKIKGDVKIAGGKDSYDIEGDFFLDFEKNNKDKIHIISSNKQNAQSKSTESKNKIEYGGKKFELNTHFNNKDKLDTTVEVVLPNERCLTMKIDLDKSKDLKSGHIQTSLTDAEKRGGPASSIVFKSKIIDSDIEHNKIDIEGQLELKLKDGKNLVNSVILKSAPGPGETFKYDFKFDVKGNLIPKPASLSADGEATTASIVDGSEKYRLKGNYGNDIGFELTGGTTNQLSEGKDKKYQEDNTLTLRLPFENAHDIKLVSHILVLHPQQSDVIVEYTIIESVQLNSDVYKVDASGKLGSKEGTSKVKLVVPHNEPFSLDVNYKADIAPEKARAHVDVKSTYGKGKTATISVKATSAPQEYGLLIDANAPQSEKLKKLEIEFLTKSPSPNNLVTSVSITADSRVYRYDTNAVYSKVNPTLDVKFQHPNSKPGRIFFKGSGISSSQGKVEVKLENVNDINFDAVSEGSIQKDNVVFKLNANSDKLNLKNYHVDISSKDSGSGKRLEFHASNDGKNIFSGSTSFISKQEGQNTIMEGSGSVKVKDEPKSANFKYIRTILTEGNEQGVETFLNLAIGDRSYVAEYRVTNMEYKNSYVYCEEKKQCANVEFTSKVNTNVVGKLEHNFIANFDLRKLGVAPEFGLQINSEVSEKKLPQYVLDLHVNKDDKKYYLHVYSQPDFGKFPAGISVTLPNREIALESLVTYPTNKDLPFPIKGEIALHMDKKKPAQTTALRYLLDVAPGNDASAVAELGFKHPKIGKEAVAKFRGQLHRGDNFIKIQSLASVSHSILGGNREGKVNFEVNPTNIKLLIDTPLVKVIDLEGSAAIKENLQQGELKFSLLQGKHVQIKALAKDYQYFEFTTGYSEESERKLSIIGHLEPEKRVDISADIILPNEKKNIIHGALFLKDNLVKSDYGLSKDNFKYFLSALQKDLNTLEQRIKQLGEKANEEFKAIVKRIQPTLKELQQAYEEEWKKLKDEIDKDKTLKEISAVIYDVTQYLAKLVDDVLEAVKPILKKICQTFEETSKKISDLYVKQVEPEVKKIYENLSAVIKNYFDGLIDIVAHFSALVQDFFEKHKPELKELTNTLAEIFKDLTRILVAQLKDVQANAAQVFASLSEQIKELPIVAVIKEKWQELAIQDQALGLIRDAHNAIRGFLPTEETRTFADLLQDYVQKKLHQQKVDDNKELRQIYRALLSALTSLVQLTRTHLQQLGLPQALSINALSFIAAPGQTSAPSLGGSASFSLIKQLLTGDIPDPLAVIRAYRPRSLNPLDEVPAKLRAVVVNGQHIFTFDGRHMTFPGNCRYILAHDHVDRNFTLALQLHKGAPKTLALEDKSGSVVELKENGEVALNGARHGFPVIGKDLFAFKEPRGIVGIGSSYGIKVKCTAKLEVCHIEINGFYLGKLRGLLGDGNNEPYDDFRMVNGKITTSESEFGNSYKLASSCAEVSSPEHHMHQLHEGTLPKACESVFGFSSTLRPLAPLLDMAPFRQACIHAASSDSKDAQRQACDLALGYTALALSGLLPAILPPVCVQCHDTTTPKNIYDTYEIRLPTKQADIIVAVDQSSSNEKNYKEVAVPLVSQIVKKLQSKGINDIKLFVVGITPEYPIVYDTDLHVENTKVSFEDHKHHIMTSKSIKTGNKQVDDIIRGLVSLAFQIEMEIEHINVVGVYENLRLLPLRAGAVKHTVVVEGIQERSSFFHLIDIIRARVQEQSFKEIALSSTYITRIPDLTNKKKPGNVVGYTRDYVLYAGDKAPVRDPEVRAGIDRPVTNPSVDYAEQANSLIINSEGKVEAGDVQNAAAIIVDNMLNTKITLECVCSYNTPFTASSVCIATQRTPGRR